MLLGHVDKPVELWKMLINSHNTKSNLEIADVDKWTNYSKNLLYNNNQTNLNDLVWPENLRTVQQKNWPSTEHYIVSIRRLKNGKSAGKDDILAEFYKSSCDIITPFLELLFNQILNAGKFPEIFRILVPQRYSSYLQIWKQR